jgi:hypothetical protein
LFIYSKELESQFALSLSLDENQKHWKRGVNDPRSKTPERPPASNPSTPVTQPHPRLSRDGLVRRHMPTNNHRRVRNLKVRLIRVNTHALLAHQIHQHGTGLVALVAELVLQILVLLHVLHVLVEQVGGIERPSLSLGMELSAEDGAGVVNQALVGLVVEVREVLAPLGGERGGIDRVPVVLGCDVAATGAEVESRNIVRAVAVLQLDGLCACGQGDELVAHADAHDGDLGGFEELAQVVDGVGAVGWVAGPVGDEDAVKVVGDLVDGVVVGEAGNAGAAGDEAAEDVLLDAAVDQGDVHVAEGGADVEGGLGGDAADQVDGLRVDEGLVLVRVVLLADGDAGERGPLLAEVGDHLASVDAGDGGDSLAGAPLGERLDGGPVAVLQGVVLDNDTRGLDVGGLEVAEQTVLVTGSGGYTVVTDQRLGEDKDLATVGGVGHGLGISDERGGEDGFTRDVGLGTKGLSGEDGAVLYRGERHLAIATPNMHTLIVKVALSVEISVGFR